MSWYLKFYFSVLWFNNIVYNTHVRDIDDLKRRIHDAIALVTEEMLKTLEGRWNVAFDSIGKTDNVNFVTFVSFFEIKICILNKTLLEILNNFLLFNHISVY